MTNYSIVSIDETNREQTNNDLYYYLCIIIPTILFIIGISLYLDLNEERNCIKIYVNETITNRGLFFIHPRFHIDNDSRIWFWWCE